MSEVPIRISVIVPMYNEASGIMPTLESLRLQSVTDFTVFLCDNASTDSTVEVVSNFITRHKLVWHIVGEKKKGTGAAADTAARAAIASGATHLARTDADTLPERDWVKKIIHEFSTTDVELIAGMVHARRDLPRNGILRRIILRWGTEVAYAFGKVRPVNRAAPGQGPYITVAGNNMAITAEMYVRAGGFPRTAIDDVHEDRELFLAVRRLTTRYAFLRSIRAYTSSRRVDAWGIVATLQWYRAHRKPAGTVDIR